MQDEPDVRPLLGRQRGEPRQLLGGAHRRAAQRRARPLHPLPGRLAPRRRHAPPSMQGTLAGASAEQRAHPLGDDLRGLPPARTGRRPAAPRRSGRRARPRAARSRSVASCSSWSAPRQVGHPQPRAVLQQRHDEPPAPPVPRPAEEQDERLALPRLGDVHAQPADEDAVGDALEGRHRRGHADRSRRVCGSRCTAGRYPADPRRNAPATSSATSSVGAPTQSAAASSRVGDGRRVGARHRAQQGDRLGAPRALPVTQAVGVEQQQRVRRQLEPHRAVGVVAPGLEPEREPGGQVDGRDPGRRDQQRLRVAGRRRDHAALGLVHDDAP